MHEKCHPAFSKVNGFLLGLQTQAKLYAYNNEWLKAL